MTNVIKGSRLSTFGVLKLMCKKILGSTVNYTCLDASPHYEDLWLMEINMFPMGVGLLKIWLTRHISME